MCTVALFSVEMCHRMYCNLSLWGATHVNNVKIQVLGVIIFFYYLFELLRVVFTHVQHAWCGLVGSLGACQASMDTLHVFLWNINCFKVFIINHMIFKRCMNTYYISMSCVTRVIDLLGVYSGPFLGC